VALAVAAVFLVLIFLDSYEKIGIQKSKELKSPFTLMANTIKHLKSLNQLLLIPLTMYTGFQQGYIGADFTKSFITCTQGIENVS
jgi:hypothetical protein